MLATRNSLFVAGRRIASSPASRQTSFSQSFTKTAAVPSSRRFQSTQTETASTTAEEAPSPSSATAAAKKAKPVYKAVPKSASRPAAKATFTTKTEAKKPEAAPTPSYANYQSPTKAKTVQDLEDIDWSESYFGVGALPIPPEQYQMLSAPLDPADIEVKPDGVIYLPEIKYRRRLNDAFGPMGWGIVPRGEPVIGDSVVTREYALIVGGR